MTTDCLKKKGKTLSSCNKRLQCTLSPISYTVTPLSLYTGSQMAGGEKYNKMTVLQYSFTSLEVLLTRLTRDKRIDIRSLSYVYSPSHMTFRCLHTFLSVVGPVTRLEKGVTTKKEQWTKGDERRLVIRDEESRCFTVCQLNWQNVIV